VCVVLNVLHITYQLYHMCVYHIRHTQCISNMNYGTDFRDVWQQMQRSEEHIHNCLPHTHKFWKKKSSRVLMYYISYPNSRADFCRHFASRSRAPRSTVYVCFQALQHAATLCNTLQNTATCKGHMRGAHAHLPHPHDNFSKVSSLLNILYIKS